MCEQSLVEDFSYPGFSLYLPLHIKWFGVGIYNFLLSFLNFKIVNLFKDIWDIYGKLSIQIAHY